MGSGYHNINGLKRLLEPMKATLLHPQWLSLRYHHLSRACLRELNHCVVLDIGSGDSDHSGLLGPACTLHRLDYPITNARYRRLPDLYADAARLPIAQASVDAVLLLEVMEHLGEDDRTLKEISRVLRPGGQFFLSVPFLYPMHDEPSDFRRYTIHGLRRILAAHGFSVIRETVHGNSIVTALQLLNLSFLEIARDAYTRSPAVGLAAALLVYPLCVAVNLAALPLTSLRHPQAACLGYFVTAVRD